MKRFRFILSKFRDIVEESGTKNYFFAANPLTLHSSCDKILHENKKHTNDRSGLCALQDTSNITGK